MTSVEVESISSAKAWKEVKHDLPQHVCDSLSKLASESGDIEVCGFVLADMTIVNIDNVADEPGSGFTMDHGQMVDIIKGKTPIVATFHSHPSGRRWPSDTDTEHMTFLYRQGCPWRYLIITVDGVFEFEHRDRS